VNRVATQPITIRLTGALLAHLQDVAITAVRARDMDSLIVLNEMRVDLRPALSHAVRSGFHEITRGLRSLGVPVTEHDVDWAMSKSPESYRSLCGEQAAPAYPETAIEAAIREGKFAFVHVLLDKWKTPVTARTLQALGWTRKAAPRDLVEKLFSRLPDSEITTGVAVLAARFGSPAIVDRVVRKAIDCDLPRLVAIAMKGANETVARELISRVSAIPASIVQHFMEAAYATDSCIAPGQEWTRNQADINFLKLAHEFDAQFGLGDVEPLLREFLTRKAWRIGCEGWTYDTTQEHEYMTCLVDVVRPEERAALAGLAEKHALGIATPRRVQENAALFAEQCRALLVASSREHDGLESWGPQP